MNLVLEILRLIAYVLSISRSLYLIWKEYKQNG